MVSKRFNTGTDDEAMRSRKASRKYFYLDGKLYRYLRKDNGLDLLVAQCYTDEKVVELPLSYVIRKRKPTFSLTQVANMLGRSRMFINHLYLFGMIPQPQKSKSPNGKHPGIYRLSEQDVYDLHTYFTRQRKAGGLRGSAKPLPSKAQLAAMMKYERATYVQSADGTFVPVYKAPEIEDWLS